MLWIIGAGDGNRTHVVSLEGWSSTIELHPHIRMVTRRRLERLTLWLKVRCSTDWASGSNINWLGYLDSNQGDDRVKVCCLTAWLYPNKMVGRGGFEPPNRKELSYSQPRLATSLPPHHWCRLKDLNPQPTDYKSVALPIELSRRIKMVEVNGLEPLTLCL